MFNNNNYLPDLNHYPPTRILPEVPRNSLPPEPALSSTAALSGTAGHSGFGVTGNFRFLSPTQGTSVPMWVPTVSAVSMASAPGVGASWQHSTPTTMPWANHTAPQFTAQSPISSVLPVRTTQMDMMTESSILQRLQKPPHLLRPSKRRMASSSPNGADGGPASKRYLSEAMAACFRQLQITPGQQGQGQGGTDACSFSSGFVHNKELNRGWQRFHELEKRLEDDLDMEEASNGALDEERKFGSRDEDRMRENGTLHIPDEVKREVENPNSVLPAHIVKTITNPCTDLVLWKPPEAILTSSLQPTPESTAITSCSSGRLGNHTNTVLSSARSRSSSDSSFSNGCVSDSVSHGINTSTNPTSSGANALQFSGGIADMDMFDSLDDDMDL